LYQRLVLMKGHRAVAEAEQKKETRPSAREPTSKLASGSVSIFTPQFESHPRFNGDLVYFPKIGTMPRISSEITSLCIPSPQPSPGRRGRFYDSLHRVRKQNAEVISDEILKDGSWCLA
jgi:hypothetical protein